jgi:hypothetical protein
VSGECGTHGRGEKLVQGFGVKPRREKHLKDQGVDWKVVPKWTLRDWLGGFEWIHLAQYSDTWRAVVNAMVNLRVLTPRS